MKKIQRGVTLIELVVSITIVAIAVTAVLGTLTILATGSAETMTRAQSLAIAQAYLEEILLKPVNDPLGTNGGTRATYHIVDDYNGLTDVGAKDQLGSAIGGLSNYTVQVAVSQVALAGIGASDVRQVDVTVTDPAGRKVILSGYRTNY